ncbi:cadherin-AgCad1-like [Rhynchophorus ferrugineus]|uniref:cadherin-AgCad1-like n=1 Tax=Rhynchophorus ferrugineus TaxID=354439 RepID=UPI003FCDD3B7
MKVPWHFLLVIHVVIVFGEDELEITRGPDIINCTRNGNYYAYMMENNHNFTDEKLLFYVRSTTGADISQCTPAFVGNTFLYKTEYVDNILEIYATQFFDYESGQTNFVFKITGYNVYVSLEVLNYDDEAPTLTSPMCSIEENTDVTMENTECTAVLTDTDGWITQTTFTVINSNPKATNDLEKEDEIFVLNIDETLDDAVTSTTVSITTKRQLDYETKIFYSFKIQAKDGAGHSTTPNENVTCIIDVIDQNDMPPQFTSYFTSKQITEKTTYTEFSVTAVDGDRGINADIIYFIESIDTTDDQEPISINKTSGELVFGPIDRDAKDLTTYQFKIRAQEVDDPPFNETIAVTLFLDDLDDNSPLVMSLINETGEIVNYTPDETKVVHFWYLENFAGTLDGTITITDIDMGNNALFDVKLSEHPDSELSYTDAFFIVPTAGYRTADFQISVRNATYLDFENPPWDDFQFYVTSSGKLDPKKTDEILIQVSLIDYNDEIPKFENSSYECWVNETIEKGKTIIQVKATDRDAEDAILSHKLVGAELITKTMDIDSAEGIITVAIDNAFDYDRINPVVVQVEAVDHGDHSTTVPVTINLLDINNKAPTYQVDGMIEVEENQVIGTVLNATITASDVDTTRKLQATIDWDKSYVMKNSQKQTNDDPTIHDPMRFLDIEFEETGDEGSISINLRLNDVNPNQTAPDYETFDVLYLNVIITDLNTLLPDFEDKMNTTAVITVNIIDINDNPPIFTNETLNKYRTVKEEDSGGTIIGSIVATDADIGDIVTYSCTYMDDRYDWFESDEEGQISVKKGSKIDCDTDKIMYVEINCTATDGLHYTPQNFTINILDINNKIPQLSVNSSDATVVELLEKSEAGTFVTLIDYEDADRDEPFHTAVCELDDYTSDCNAAFKTESNNVRVKNGATLDRDRGLKNYTCHVTCTDNPKNVDEQGHKTNETSFVIILLDINDNWPEFIPTDLSTSENAKQGYDIGVLQAEDIDEGENADIDFNILRITKDGQEISNDIFELIEMEDYVVSDTIKQNHLKAKQDLIDAYGTYVIYLNLTDRGKPPLSTEDSDYVGEKPKVTVTVKKFNYYQPQFMVPNPDDVNSTKFYLSLDQEDDSILRFYTDNEEMTDFEIQSVPEGCSDKWSPIFTIDQTSPASTTFFTIPYNACTAQLQVHNYDKAQAKSVVIYKLKVTASLAIVDEIDPEEKDYNTTVDITLSFIDIDQEPIFDDNDQPCVLYFLQGRVNTDNSTAALDRKANYPKSDVTFSIFYFLRSDDEEIKNTFKIDSNTGDVTLKQKLYYNKQKWYKFEIIASKNQSQVVSSNNSVLTVEINVVDSNIHTPQWTQASFYGAIMKSTTKGTVITTVEATDEDEIDQGKLEYSIEECVPKGSDSIAVPKEPFTIKAATGEISLNFVVDYNMYGYFKLTVKVKDQQDPYGNPVHENSTTVTINIVTEDNTAAFRFDNTLDEITNSKTEILSLISQYVGWDCHDQNIQHDSENGNELVNTTVASIYCIDNDELRTSSEILKQLSNIQTFQNLRKDLMKLGVYLQTFTSETVAVENLEQVLKTALIIVTIVLGTLCAILAITFFLKIRGLNKRLSKLTEQKFGSDESNLNRKAINFPNTNMFAVEGSNPVFNNEIDKSDLIDKDSIHSNESDLIGVEDNPEFDIFGEHKERF